MSSLRRWLAVLVIAVATATMTACPDASKKDEPKDTGYSLSSHG